MAIENEKLFQTLRSRLPPIPCVHVCSKNKGADQLRGYCAAYLRLCFHIMQTAGLENNDTDQPVHLFSLVNTFVVPCLDRIITLVMLSEMSYHKVPKFLDARNFAVIHLKFKQIGPT